MRLHGYTIALVENSALFLREDAASIRRKRSLSVLGTHGVRRVLPADVQALAPGQEWDEVAAGACSHAADGALGSGQPPVRAPVGLSLAHHMLVCFGGFEQPRTVVLPAASGSAILWG